MNALAPVAPKLAKLIPMLSSDKEGEVLATVDAIRRTLQSTGLDFHDLARALASTRENCRVTDRSPPYTPAPSWRALAPEDQLTWLRRVESELAVSPWEQEFVKSIIRQVADAPNLRISAKQISVLDRLLERLQEAA